jgi:phage tail-like protein
MPTNLDPQNLLSPAAIGGLVALSQPSAAVDHTEYAKYGMAMRFRVVVDQLGKLGSWHSCKGLKVNFKTTAIASGGDYTSSTLLPDRVEYGPITLERAIRGPDTSAVQTWLRQVQAKWLVPGQQFQPQTAVITLLDATQNTLMSWTLRDVCPVSWSCAPFTAKSTDVAIETLELQHGGFL